MTSKAFFPLFVVLAALAAPAMAAQDTAPYWPDARPEARSQAKPSAKERTPVWTVADDDDPAPQSVAQTRAAKAKAPQKSPKMTKAPAVKKAVKKAGKTAKPSARPAAKSAVTPVKAKPVQTKPVQAKPAPAKPAPAALTSPRPVPAKPVAPVQPAKPVATKPGAPQSGAPKPAPPKSAAYASATEIADRIIFEDATGACSAGDADACALLGRMYATGTATPKDEAAAARSYARSCNLGNVTACKSVKRAKPAAPKASGWTFRMPDFFGPSPKT